MKKRSVNKKLRDLSKLKDGWQWGSGLASSWSLSFAIRFCENLEQVDLIMPNENGSLRIVSKELEFTLYDENKITTQIILI